MDIGWMVAPAVACLVIAGVLGWFGLQVLERGVIFVDLALAQIAALGTTYAVFLGHDPDEPMAYALGLAATVIGAVAFALARAFEDRVPQEALIGTAYVVSAAAGAVLLDFAADAHGAEKLQHLMVGNVVWVRWSEIAILTAVGVAVGVFHLLARRPLLAASFGHVERGGTVQTVLWDLAFYLTFGLVITTIVHIAGVLLIFSYLIVPAVVARLFARRVGPRLAIAWGVSLPISVLGVGVSYEHAAGPIIVVLLGLTLLVALVGLAVRRSRSPLALVGAIALAASLLVVGHWALTTFGADDHDHVAEAHAEAPVADGLDPAATPAEREQWYRAHLHEAGALRAALPREDDDSLALLVATALVRLGDDAGLAALAGLAASEVPFIRMEADDRLRAISGEAGPAFDPFEGPDAAGVWRSWAAQAPQGWAERAAAVALP